MKPLYTVSSRKQREPTTTLANFKMTVKTATGVVAVHGRGTDSCDGVTS